MHLNNQHKKSVDLKVPSGKKEKVEFNFQLKFFLENFQMHFLDID